MNKSIINTPKFYLFYCLFVFSYFKAYSQEPVVFQHSLIVPLSDNALEEFVSVKMLITEGTINGPIVFEEEHDSLQCRFNLIYITIGTQQSLNHIEWADSVYYISFLINDTVLETMKFYPHRFDSIKSEPIIDYTIGYQQKTTRLNLSYFTEIIEIQKEFLCEDKVYYGGRYYSTVQIGDQCWFAENLNIGTIINSRYDQLSDCSNIRKYCYNNDEKYCEIFGGLYSWRQAMCGSKIEGSQGICPAGWHIPTHNDWTTLERYICEQQNNTDCDKHFPYNRSAWGLRGNNEGHMLKAPNQWPYNESNPYEDIYGFSAYPGSATNNDGRFLILGQHTGWWTSTYDPACVPQAWNREISINDGRIFRFSREVISSHAVRCIKKEDE